MPVRAAKYRQGASRIARRRIWGFCLALWVVLLCGYAGCRGKVPDEGTKQGASEKKGGLQTSMTGNASKTYSCTLPEAVAAVKSALKKLSISIVDESGSIFKKSLDAESQDGTSIATQITETTKTTTRISVKVGRLFGDNDAARRIHSEIESELIGKRETKAGWSGFSGFGGFPKPSKAIPKKANH